MNALLYFYAKIRYFSFDLELKNQDDLNINCLQPFTPLVVQKIVVSVLISALCQSQKRVLLQHSNHNKEELRRTGKYVGLEKINMQQIPSQTVQLFI